MLAFTSVYFFGSRLFNGLQPIQIKKFLPSHSVPKTPPAPCSGLFVSSDFLETQTCFRHEEVYNIDFGIQQAYGAKKLTGFGGSRTPSVIRGRSERGKQKTYGPPS